MRENEDFINIENDTADSSSQTDTEAEEKKSGASVSVFEWVQSMMNAIVIVILLLTFVFRLINVDGESMLPTLLDGDKVIITNFDRDYNYGDIVVISRGAKLDKVLIKRVIATEGQIVDIDNSGCVKVDNVIIDDSSYVSSETYRNADTEFPLTVGEDQVFVLGDNRLVSKDSRSTEVGLIDVDNIIGKAHYVVFPFDRFQKIELE